MRKSITICCIILSLSFLAIREIAAQSLKIGLYDVPPLGFIDSEKNIVGIIPEITEQIEKKTGLTIHKKLMPWKRIVLELSSGNIDLAFGLVEEFPSDIIIISKVYKIRNIIVYKKGILVSRYEDLRNLKMGIGIMRGAYAHKRLIEDPLIKKYYLTDYEQAVKMLAKGRIDAAAVSDSVGFILINKLKLKDEIIFPGYVYSRAEISLMMSRKSSQNISDNTRLQLKKALDYLRAKGIINDILDKYIGKGWNR